MNKRTAWFIVLPGFIILCLFLIKELKPGVEISQHENADLITTGRYLFFDNRLSFNNSKSCGSCHDPKFAFTDGYRRSVTANGENLKHNAPSLINIAFQYYFDWASPTVTSLEKQQERPLFNEHPLEMGVKGNEDKILNKLSADALYQQLFAHAFPGEKAPFRFGNIIKAIAAFERSLQSFNSPYDQFLKGDSLGLSSSARSGLQLFFSDRLKCASCHSTKHFTNAADTNNTDSIYLNTGLYNIAGKNKYPPNDNGLFAITGNAKDDGKFKIPSLRNVALTAPYMHDGSINTLEEVIDTYAGGGRTISDGPDSGDGKTNMLKDRRISGFTLSAAEKKQLIDFLFCLTDSSVLTNPAFQNPFNLKSN